MARERLERLKQTETPAKAGVRSARAIWTPGQARGFDLLVVLPLRCLSTG